MINNDTCDLLITGATVFDGSGGPGALVDVAVTDGRIAAVGALASMRAREVMIADGKVTADPSAGLVASVATGAGSVTALAFNPHDASSLGVGGSDGSFIVVSLANLGSPEATAINLDQKQGGEITRVSFAPNFFF